MMLLHHERVSSGAGVPALWALVLHGVFGSGGNWRSFARRLTTLRPDWGFVLVDLRGHGRSPHFPAPHDLDAVAGDLGALVSSLELPIRAVIGHSLGGKCALAYARAVAGELDQVWMLDSQPSARPFDDASPTLEVLSLLESLPKLFSDRRSFVETVKAAGHGSELASWLAMSLEATDAGHRLVLDLPGIRELLEAYFAHDAWPELDRDDGRRELHVVMALRSYVWSIGDRARLEAWARTAPRRHHHVIERAGHWLHVDAPDELASALAAGL